MKKEKVSRHLRAFALVCLVAATAAALLGANGRGQAAKVTADLSGEEKAEERLKTARANPEQLRDLLKRIPKGADLHYHLSGGVYAESFISWAAEDGLCVDLKKLALAKCATSEQSLADVVAAAEAFRSHALYDRLVDSFSMRGFQGTVKSGHDHF